GRPSPGTPAPEAPVPAPPPEPPPEPAPAAEPQPAPEPQLQQPEPQSRFTATRPRRVVIPRPHHEDDGNGHHEDDAPIGIVRAKRRPVEPQPGAPGMPHRPLGIPRRRRGLRRAVALLFLIVLVAIGYFLWRLYQPFHGSGHGRVVVTIPSGSTASDIGDLLARDHVVSSSFFFDLRTRIGGHRGDLRSGTFTMKRDMSYAAAIAQLTTAPPAAPVIHITIPEGPSRGEMAPRIHAAGLKGSYLAASKASPELDPTRYGAPRGASLEGFLFPATYELVRTRATATRLVTEQLQAFKRNFAGVNLGYARRKHLTAFDVVTIASMVEREAQVPKDRPLIAAVIYNRLHDHIPLGIDATLRYALHDWTRPLLVSQLRSPSAYNTRTHLGLPPGPIGNPGLASLQAAAHPAHVPYLYYVVKPCGNGAHAFSSTAAAFQRDVNAYDAARAKNHGNDPSHCGKR
ncbi:MAG TPA: endolytic transglycosylase MltG, partial [Solirubrobacteraceae bacterium]|nr:endolytic transglycosylase MltG [Solirubrobacteraceae bacterium]